jgi:hypothetical protein
MERQTTAISEHSRLGGNVGVGSGYVLGVLFFGGLWGILEATLGDTLYSAGLAHVSVPLTVGGFAVLSVARAYFPRGGTATLISFCAMLYKFQNTPFFACHLLGIALTGVCFDAFFALIRMKSKGLAGALAMYSNYAAFALMITYVARYEHWVRGGFGRVVRHVGIDGSMAAMACILVVPLSMRFGERLKSAAPASFVWRNAMIPRTVAGITAGLWVLGLAAYVLNHAPHP